MRRLCDHRITALCSICCYLASAASAWGILNNGFDTDYVYALEAGGARLRLFSEVDGARLSDNIFAPTTDLYWASLTFSGVGANDARLFLAKEIDTNADTTADDVKVLELDSAGREVNSIFLSAIAGSPVSNATLVFGNIRFSKSRPESLIMSATSDVSGEDRGMAWEIDLGLTTLKNTYTGPVMAPPDAYDSSLRSTIIAINDNDGTLYMTGRYLNEPDRSTGLGDLVAFDTTNGSTNAFTLLIDGASYAAGSPTPSWYWPQFLVFRSSNPTDATPTVLVAEAKGSGWTYISEFYLDTTAHPVDVNGNLQQRSFTPDFEGKFPSKGQQDEITQSVWYGGAIGGLYEIQSDDVVRAWNFLASQPKINIADADSPFHPGPFPPSILEVTPDPDLAELGVEYTKQLAVRMGNPPITWEVIEGPAGLQVDNTGRVYGWTPAHDQIGFHTLEVQASNVAGADSETWQVRVLDQSNNGFRKEWVYMCRSYKEDGNIRIFWENDGSHAVSDWTPLNSRDISLTFSGRGNHDARLFAIKADPLPGLATDILIRELNADALQVNQAKLGQLAGLGANSLGANIEDTHIRYSAYHDTLFIGVNPDKTTSTPALVYEVNLALTDVLNVYTGPSVTGGAVDVAVDPLDGTLYVVNPDLNGASGLGDLIAFDTTLGSTSSYTTLIDADILGDAKWDSPRAVAYRGKRNPSHRPTILVMMKGDQDDWPVLEFYLDELDANGNLVKRGEPMIIDDGQSGQLDMASGMVWLAGLDGGTDMVGLPTDDTEYRPGPGSTRDWLDAASPPGLPVGTPCNLDVFADEDRDGDVDQHDFALFQICYTGQRGGIPWDLTYCQCFDRDGDADVDLEDFTAFEACSTGPAVLLDQRHPPTDCVP